MSIFPLGWGQATQPAPVQSVPDGEGSPVSEINGAAESAAIHAGNSVPQALDFSSTQSSILQSASVAASQTRGFLHIVRHGAGPFAIYVVTYCRLNNDNGAGGSVGASPEPVLAEGATLLIELLERLGVDFKRHEVRGAMEDILRLGSANIPDLWLSDEQMLEKGLVES